MDVIRTLSPAGWSRLALALGLAALMALTLLWSQPAWGEVVATETPGSRLFQQHCIGCHVGGGNIIRRGKTLKLKALERQGIADPESIARIAAEGIGSMAGYREPLGEDGADLVAAWIWEQARVGWPQG